MFAATYNLTVDRASTWSMVLTLKDPSGAPINYTNASNFTGHVRLAYSTSKVAEFTFTAISAGAGTLSMTLPVTETNKLTPDTEYQYDVFLDLSSVKTKILTGSLTCRANITR
jgi:hypothetical protein